MRRFLKTISFSLAPLVAILAVLILWDPFKVFLAYDNYYTPTDFVALNRENVCVSTLEKNRETHNFNAFIFGSSRSQSIKCSVWRQYFDESFEPFHFDASAENIQGVRSK